ADHREALSIEQYVAPGDVGCAAKTLLPEPMTDHHDGMRTRRHVISRTEQASGGHTRAKHLEVVAGNDVSADLIGIAAGIETYGDRTPRRDGGKDVVLVAHLRHRRIREDAAVRAVGDPDERCGIR